MSNVQDEDGSCDSMLSVIIMHNYDKEEDICGMLHKLKKHLIPIL